jgi:uncharacterized protein (TIGR03435 family)
MTHVGSGFSRTFAGLLLGTALLAAQSAPPSFEVASIREHVDRAPTVAMMVNPDGGLAFRNVSLREIIATAYGFGLRRDGQDLSEYKLIGPERMLSMRFDITSRAPAGSTRQDAPAMIQTLLADRFRLRLHQEVRPTPVYALTVAREGSLGPRMQRTAINCEAAIAAGVRKETADAETLKSCWSPVSAVQQLESGIRTDVFTGTITDLLRRIEGSVDRLVIDDTRLTGTFAWSMTYRRNQLREVDAPTIFSALEEQLGLKLVARTVPYEVYVVDSVEMPTPD